MEENEALDILRKDIKKKFASKGEKVINKNLEAIELAKTRFHKVVYDK
jgi:hypothetical protein